MRRYAARSLASAAWLGAVLAVAAPGPSDDGPQPLATVPVRARTDAGAVSFDGVVQAVKQTTLAAQVAGAVVALPIKAGEHVKEGQLLVQLDARAARQQASAAAAQVQAARAAQDAATREFERQSQLFAKNYISRAALDQAEAQYKTAQAQATAELASAEAARTQSGFYVVRAPYEGLVSDVPVVLGDMAMPGRALLTLYDPRTLRVSAVLPQTVAALLAKDQPVTVELPGVGARIVPVRWEVLPTADPATHTVELRADLPPHTGAFPGSFARAWLLSSAEPTRLSVPARSVVRRAELTAVYVLAADGRPLLRQVRLGRASGEEVEVLTGVSAGERVVLDPQAAARTR